eukprot:156541_1
MHSWLSGSGPKKTKSSGSVVFPSLFGFGRKNTVNKPSQTNSNNITNTTSNSNCSISGLTLSSPPKKRANRIFQSNRNNEFDRADDVVLKFSSDPNLSPKPIKTVRFADVKRTNEFQMRERRSREARAKREEEREKERERERSRSRESERKKQSKEKQKQWIKRTDSRIICLANEVKRLRSKVQNIEQRLDENEKRNSVFVIAPNGERGQTTHKAIPYYDYGQQTEHVQTMMNPFICALNEALDPNQQNSAVNINFISLNQTRNKIATHNQTVKMNENTPRVRSLFDPRPVVRVRSSSNDNDDHHNHNRSSNQDLDSKQTSSSRFRWKYS